MSEINHLATSIGLTNSRNGFHDRFIRLTAEGDAEGMREHVLVKLGLITSEIAEAMEEIRSGRGIAERYYGENGKPEGVPVEIVDAIIRAFDLLYLIGVTDPEELIREKLEFNAARAKMHGKTV